MSGHVFIARGDLTKLSCDAWLMPCDAEIDIQRHWISGVEGLSENWTPSSSSLSQIGEGKERCVRIENWPSDLPSPFLTNTGGHLGSSLEWYMEGVKEFIEKAFNYLTEKNHETTRNREKFLLALPLVGVGAGGAASRAGLIVEALMPSMHQMAAKLNVDIALVIKDEIAYSAAQVARRRLHSAGIKIWPDWLDQNYHKQALQLSELALKGDLVLFLGAGVSAGSGIPLWGELLTRLAVSAEIIQQGDDRIAFENLDFLDKARLISLRLGRQRIKLGDEVARILCQYKQCSLNHMMLASLPVNEIITTNYDKLFENASDAIDRNLAILPYHSARTIDRWLLKMHGCVSKPDDIVLTRSDYLGYNEKRAALKGIVQAMLITKHMLFVGFSLTDDNFHMIIEDVRKAVRAGEEVGSHNGKNSFGTALTLNRSHFFEELWSGDIEWISFFNKTNHDRSIVEVARLQEIFLDCLSFYASSSVSHILDESYNDHPG